MGVGTYSLLDGFVSEELLGGSSSESTGVASLTDLAQARSHCEKQEVPAAAKVAVPLPKETSHEKPELQ